MVLGSAAAALELAVSGTVPLGVALPAMVSVHMVIGLGEAFITVAVVAGVLAARPDLVKAAYPFRRPRKVSAPPAAAGSGMHAAVGTFVAPASWSPLHSECSSRPSRRALRTVSNGWRPTRASRPPPGAGVEPLSSRRLPVSLDGRRQSGTAVAGLTGTCFFAWCCCWAAPSADPVVARSDRPLRVASPKADVASGAGVHHGAGAALHRLDARAKIVGFVASR